MLALLRQNVQNKLYNKSLFQSYAAETIYDQIFSHTKTLSKFISTYSCAIWQGIIVLHVCLALWVSRIITCSHLLRHRRHRAADAGSWGNKASSPGSLRDSVGGTAERRPSSEVWCQLHWPMGHAADLHHSQVRQITNCLPLQMFNLKAMEPQNLACRKQLISSQTGLSHNQPS